MPDSTLPISLKDLQIALSKLNGHDLPDETRDALAAVEEQLSQLSEKGVIPSEDILEKKAEFISLVSHELRIPLTAIKGYTDLILKGMVGEINNQQREFLKVVAQNIERMNTLISDLRDITRLETGRTRFEIEDVSLVFCARTAASNAGALIEAGGHRLDVAIPDSIPEVSADRSRVIQVLTILLNNAGMYSNQGGMISIRAHQQENYVRVDVQDNGHGISPADKPRVFEQFFRSDDENVRKHQGWGLQLNVAMHLIQAMGGKIGVESETGQGSTFWFTLPVAQH